MNEVDEPSEPLRYVFIERPRCPSCGSGSLKTRKTLPSQGDDSVTRDTLCKSCGWTFYVVVE